MFYAAQIKQPGDDAWHYIARGRVVRADNAKAYHHPSAARAAGEAMIRRGLATVAQVVPAPRAQR